jgi:integrase
VKATGTDDEEKASAYLAKRIEEIRSAKVFGVRPRRTFREAATKYLTDFSHKPGISRAATALKDMDRFIGDKWIDQIHNETFKPYIETRRKPTEGLNGKKSRKGLAIGTINRNLGVARRILRLCERLWRDEESGISWLAHAPLIQLLDDSNARTAYPISWAEQDSFFAKLTEHLRDMAAFDVNTGLRDQELCGLQWAWEHRFPNSMRRASDAQSSYCLRSKTKTDKHEWSF